MINCEISLNLTWSENCLLTSKAARDGNGDVNPPTSEINNPTNAISKITDYKLYVPVLTLSAKNDNRLLEKLKAGFKITSE